MVISFIHSWRSQQQSTAAAHHAAYKCCLAQVVSHAAEARCHAGASEEHKQQEEGQGDDGERQPLQA
jgi:hypothetical protein